MKTNIKRAGGSIAECDAAVLASSPEKLPADIRNLIAGDSRFDFDPCTAANARLSHGYSEDVVVIGLAVLDRAMQPPLVCDYWTRYSLAFRTDAEVETDALILVLRNGSLDFGGLKADGSYLPAGKKKPVNGFQILGRAVSEMSGA